MLKLDSRKKPKGYQRGTHKKIYKCCEFLLVVFLINEVYIRHITIITIDIFIDKTQERLV